MSDDATVEERIDAAVRMARLEAVAEAADLIHAHGPGKPMRMPDDCPLCAALRELES
jgi:hypothetical protein